MPADYDPLHIAADRLRADPEHKAIYAEPRGLFDWDWSPLTLWDAWSLRQLDPYSVDLKKLFRGELTLQPEAGFCEEERRWHSVQERIRCHIERRVGSRNAYVVLALYWLSEKVRRSGEEPILVNMKKHQADWLELCHRVEEKMKTLVHEKELVVEVNPTANRIIGPMDRYDQHHVFNLTLDENRRLSREVRVCVNTDNPAVCNTTLAHEHYILGEILIAEGVPEAEVVKWLDWLRENGNKYNFARRLKSADEDPSMEALLTWLRRIRPDVREERSPARKHQAFWNWMRETRLQDSGFTREDLDRQSHDVLERIVALEAQLKTWKIAAREASDSNFSHWEAALQKIEDELAMLRESCIT